MTKEIRTGLQGGVQVPTGGNHNRSLMIVSCAFSAFLQQQDVGKAGRGDSFCASPRAERQDSGAIPEPTV